MRKPARKTRKQKLAERRAALQTQTPAAQKTKPSPADDAEKHGYHHAYVILQCEERSAWERHLRKYFEIWKPEGQTEYDLVNDIAVCRWRLNRFMAMEAAAMDLSLDRQREAFQQEFTKSDEITRLTLAYQKMCDGSKLIQSFAQAETRLRRTIDQAVKQLRVIQHERRANELELDEIESNNVEPNEIEAKKRPEPEPLPVPGAPTSANQPGLHIVRYERQNEPGSDAEPDPQSEEPGEFLDRLLYDDDDLEPQDNS